MRNELAARGDWFDRKPVIDNLRKEIADKAGNDPFLLRVLELAEHLEGGSGDERIVHYTPLRLLDAVGEEIDRRSGKGA